MLLRHYATIVAVHDSILSVAIDDSDLPQILTIRADRTGIGFEPSVGTLHLQSSGHPLAY